MSNAIKYTEEGGRIKVRAELTESGNALEISVQDTGVGIPEEHLPHLFDRFYRVENKVHTVKGTGLGLHLVKVAIEKHHNGEVFVKSEVGVGSTFGFRIPLAVPGADVADATPDGVSAGA
jgi:signal transduction histidine kinase